MRILTVCLIVAVSDLSLAKSGRDAVNASDVTWAHAVNSRLSLEKELSGDMMFLEADISLGHVVGKEEGETIPIMAHPPSTTSDISFEDWLKTVIASKKEKGIKLDFKVIEVVEPSLKTLDLLTNQLTFPLWLNADILPGPVNASRLPVDAVQFLSLCRQYFPNATLSIGWTTFWDPTVPPNAMRYDWNTVLQMADTVQCNSVSQPLTFPVRAAFVGQSLAQLSWLVATIPDSSLTVWNTPFDPVDLMDLLRLRAVLPRSLVYYDLLQLTEEFSVQKNTVKGKPDGPVTVQIVKSTANQQGIDCLSKVLVTPKSVMFRGNDRFAALMSPVAQQNCDGRSLKITGKIELFGGWNEGNNFTLFLADSKVFPAVHLTSQGGSPDETNFWSTLDGSTMYQVPVDVSTSKCQHFQLDTSANPPLLLTDCGSDLSKKGRAVVEQSTGPNVAQNDRVVFGFVVTGTLQGVVYDIQADNTECSGGSGATRLPSASLLLTILCSFVMYWMVL